MAIITTLLIGILASLIAAVIFLLFRERFVKIARYYYKRGDYVVTHLGYETKFTNIDDETVHVNHIINYGLVGLEDNYKNFYVEFSSDAALDGMQFWHPDGSEIPIREIRGGHEEGGTHQFRYPDITLNKGEEIELYTSYTLEDFPLDPNNQLFYDCSKFFNSFIWDIEMPFPLYNRCIAFIANIEYLGHIEPVDLSRNVIYSENAVRFHIDIDESLHPPGQINFYWVMDDSGEEIMCPSCQNVVYLDSEVEELSCDNCDARVMVAEIIET